MKQPLLQNLPWSFKDNKTPPFQNSWQYPCRPLHGMPPSGPSYLHWFQLSSVPCFYNSISWGWAVSSVKVGTEFCLYIPGSVNIHAVNERKETKLLQAVRVRTGWGSARLADWPKKTGAWIHASDDNDPFLNSVSGFMAMVPSDNSGSCHWWKPWGPCFPLSQTRRTYHGGHQSPTSILQRLFRCR